MTALVRIAIFTLIFVIVIGFIAMLPTVTINKNAVVTSSAYQWIRAGLWFLPTGAVAAIFVVQLALWSFRVLVAIIKSIWDMLPF